MNYKKYFAVIIVSNNIEKVYNSSKNILKVGLLGVLKLAKAVLLFALVIKFNT